MDTIQFNNKTYNIYLYKDNPQIIGVSELCDSFSNILWMQSMVAEAESKKNKYLKFPQYSFSEILENL